MSIITPAAHSDSASAAAAKVVLGNLERQVGAPNATSVCLTNAIIHVYGVVWNRTANSTVITDPINKIPQHQRNPPYPKGNMAD